jgi:hypothetical protein
MDDVCRGCIRTGVQKRPLRISFNTRGKKGYGAFTIAIDGYIVGAESCSENESQRLIRGDRFCANLLLYTEAFPALLRSDDYCSTSALEVIAIEPVMKWCITCPRAISVDGCSITSPVEKVEGYFKEVTPYQRCVRDRTEGSREDTIDFGCDKVLAMVLS